MGRVLGFEGQFIRTAENLDRLLSRETDDGRSKAEVEQKDEYTVPTDEIGSLPRL